MLYVYALTDSSDTPAVAGLADAVLSSFGSDGLYAVCSEHDDPRLEADETSLWEHERVVEAMLDHGAVLPMRFGSSVPDQEALRRMLDERRYEFELGLDRVRGAVEIGVRAMIRGGSAEPVPALAGGDRPGTAYMLARLNGQKRLAAIAAHVHEPLLALSRASISRPTSLTGSVNTAYLVNREDVDPFRAIVEKLDDSVEDATIVCTGPWPPYSFVPEEPVR